MQRKGDHNQLWSAKWNRLEKVGCGNKTSSRVESIEGECVQMEEGIDKKLESGTNSMK